MMHTGSVGDKAGGSRLDPTKLSETASLFHVAFVGVQGGTPGASMFTGIVTVSFGAAMIRASHQRNAV